MLVNIEPFKPDGCAYSFLEVYCYYRQTCHHQTVVSATGEAYFEYKLYLEVSLLHWHVNNLLAIDVNSV